MVSWSYLNHAFLFHYHNVVLLIVDLVATTMRTWRWEDLILNVK